VQHQFAAAAERQARHRGHDRHAGVFHRQMRLLQFGHFRLDRLDAARHEQRQHRLQVGAGRERAAGSRIGAPQHQAFVVVLGFSQRLGQTGNDAGADDVHLGLQGQDQHLVLLVPDAHRLIFEYRGARGTAIRGSRPRDRRTEHLALIHRQRRTRHIGLARGGIGTRRARAAVAGCRHPRRAARLHKSAAGVDISFDPARDLLPAGALPGLERSGALAEAPAHGEIDVARVVGNRFRWTAM
jgi:hypothetical protein